MRSTSNAHRSIATLLAALQLLLGPVWAHAEAASVGKDNVVLIRLAGAGVDDESARSVVASLSERLAVNLAVKFVSPTLPPEIVDTGPAADPETSARESRDALARAVRQMEQAEIEPALASLEESLKAHRIFLLARGGTGPDQTAGEILFRLGVVRLWKGDRSGAVDAMRRSRVFRHDFSPDPAIFSPEVVGAWRDAGEGTATSAVVVTSVPPGAEIAVNGRPVGKAPLRVTVPPGRFPEISASTPGYRTRVVRKAWLPGEIDSVELSLSVDPRSELVEKVARSIDDPAIPDLLARIAMLSGTSRVLAAVVRGNGAEREVVMIGVGTGGGKGSQVVPVRIVTRGAKSVDSEEVAAKLVAAGWPQAPAGEAERPWYRSWWLAAGAVVVVIIAALSGGGGGGSGGTSSTGTIGVTF